MAYSIRTKSNSFSSKSPFGFTYKSPFGFTYKSPRKSQVIEFLEWLKKRYESPEFLLKISSSEIDKIVYFFCMENKYSDLSSFNHEVRRLIKEYREKTIDKLIGNAYKITDRKNHINYPFEVESGKFMKKEYTRYSAQTLIDKNYGVRNNHNFRNIKHNTEKISQGSKFLEWLKKSHPKLDILGNIPLRKIEEISFNFSVKHGDKNPLEFSKEVLGWILNKSDKYIIEKLIEIRCKIKMVNRPDNLKLSAIDRYWTINFHGVFLFLAAENLPDFINVYWEDLNFLTSDYIDIYFSYEDLVQRVSGFEILNEFRNLSLESISLPGFIFWEKNLKDAVAINLEELSHRQIFILIQVIVNSIKSQNDLSQICNKARSYIRSITENSILTRVEYNVKGQVQSITAGGHVEVNTMTQGDINKQSGNFGIGHMSGGEIQEGAKVAGIINEAQQQNLSEAVGEVQKILQQLSQEYPTGTVTEKMTIATEAVKQIEADPTLKQRLLNAAKEGGLAAIEKTLDNPIGAFMVSAIKGWQEAE